MLLILALGVACQADQGTAAAYRTTGASKDKPLQYLLDKYLQPYPDELTVLATPKDTAILAAMKAYNAGDYAAAIDLFPNFARNYGQVGYIHLYKGISELLADREYDAFATFQLIRADQGKAFQISDWYLTMNYVGFNNVYEARRKLEAIIATKGYPLAEAQALLKALPQQ